MEKSEQDSYKQIAKTTGVFGVFQLINIVLGIIRTKILAVLLETAGVGLSGLFQSVTDFIRTVAGLGISFSSVKEISESSISGETTKMQTTIKVIKRLLLITGIAGMFLMIAFSGYISEVVFQDKSKVIHICVLSFSVLTGILSSGQIAYLQGTRQILKMAKASIYGATGGFVISVLFYIFLGIDGIVPALLGISVINMVFSWWFSRKEFKSSIKISAKETIQKGGGLLKLGFFTMLSGLAATFTMLLLKSYILKTEDLDSVGLFQAVWSISFMYIGALLSSMGSDYYPKLCSLNGDNREMVKFANQQTRFVLLVASPLLITLIIFSAPALRLLYSVDFLAASDLLKLQLVGTFLKISVWPIGYFLLAKNKGLLFFAVEFLWFFVYYVSVIAGWKYFGLNAAGVAYIVAYLIYFPAVFFAVKPLSDFKYETKNIKYFFVFIMLIIISLTSFIYTKGLILYIISAVLISISIFISVNGLRKIFSLNTIIEKIRGKLLK